MIWDVFKFTNFSSFFYPRQSYLDRVMKNARFTFLGEGRHRRVYRSNSGKYVLKFPMNTDGWNANKQEHSMYRGNKDRYAACRMVDGYVLMMRWVKPVKVTKAVRDCFPWMEEIDNYQIGMLANKKLVAYDYAGAME